MDTCTLAVNVHNCDKTRIRASLRFLWENLYKNCFGLSGLVDFHGLGKSYNILYCLVKTYIYGLSQSFMKDMVL